MYIHLLFHHFLSERGMPLSCLWVVVTRWRHWPFLHSPWIWVAHELLIGSRRMQPVWRSVLWPVMILVWPPNSWTASPSSRLGLEMFGTSFVPLVYVVGSRATQVQRGQAPTLPRRRSFRNCCLVFLMVLEWFGMLVSPTISFGAVFHAWGTHPGIEGCWGRCSGTLPAAQGMAPGECWLALAGCMRAGEALEPEADGSSTSPRSRGRNRQGKGRVWGASIATCLEPSHHTQDSDEWFCWSDF